jgi:VanZ family protein
MLWRIEKILTALDKKYWRTLFWLYWIACTVLLLLPGKLVPTFNIWDKLEHAGMFLPMLWLALLGYTPGWRLVPLSISLTGYGVAIEILQYFIPGRSCSGLDMVADATGVATGAVIVWLWKRWATPT